MKIIEGSEIKELSPEIIASIFWNLNDAEQAMFFNELARIAEDSGLSFQLQYITNNSGLNLAGRRVMQAIGEYSHWGLVPSVVNGVVR